MSICKVHHQPVQYQCSSVNCQASVWACRFCLPLHYDHPDLVLHVGLHSSRHHSLFNQLRKQYEDLVRSELNELQVLLQKQPESNEEIGQRLQQLFQKTKASFTQIKSIGQKAKGLPKYRFSKGFKGKSMEVIKPTKVVSHKKFNGEGDSTLALVQPSINIHENCSIAFKIGEVAYVGVAFKNIAQLHEFGFKDPENHGCHLVTWDGWAFSHSTQSFNNKRSEFIFCHNDIIQVTYEVKDCKLIFDKNKGENKFVIPMDRSHLDLFQGNLYFCVALWTAGNESEIVL